ncbi:putative transposase [Neisseria meningitidis 98008]|nr:putative transposase [Neisseria meningitidis 98008]
MIIANPRQTHQFAQSQPLTKTDAKDAKMPAFFAQMTAQKEDSQTMPYHPPPKWKKCWKPWLTAATNWWICGLPRKTVCIRFMKRKSKASNN